MHMVFVQPCAKRNGEGQGHVNTLRIFFGCRVRPNPRLRRIGRQRTAGRPRRAVANVFLGSGQSFDFNACAAF